METELGEGMKVIIPMGVEEVCVVLKHQPMDSSWPMLTSVDHRDLDIQPGNGGLFEQILNSYFSNNMYFPIVKSYHIR